MDTDVIAGHVRMCAACPKMCRHVCPTFFAWKSDSPTPHSRALLIHQDIIGTRNLDERAIEVIYQCLECSHCLTWCKPEIDIAEIVEQKRTELVKEGRYPRKLEEMRKNISDFHNPYGEKDNARIQWNSSNEKAKGKKVFYFAGCTASYREQTIAKETVSSLGNLGFQVVVDETEQCCGSPLFRTGFTDDALRKAEFNTRLLNETDCESIIVTCPGCYRALTRDYPKHGLEINKPIQHISEFLSERLESLPAKQMQGSFTYHDPCHLGRHLGVYDAPRSVLNRIFVADLIEMERHGDNATCCGNGAGLRTLFSEQAHEIGAERVKQALRTGADYLITACPFCKNMLDSESDGQITVLDLSEIIGLAMRSKD